MNFGQALEQLKNGMAICRSGWNGKGMFIWLEKGIENERADAMYLVTANNFRFAWTPNMMDCLSEDWEIKKEIPFWAEKYCSC